MTKPMFLIIIDLLNNYVILFNKKYFLYINIYITISLIFLFLVKSYLLGLFPISSSSSSLTDISLKLSSFLLFSDSLSLNKNVLTST